MMRMIIRIKLSIFPLMIFLLIIIIIIILIYLGMYTMLLTTGPCCNKFLAHLPQPEQKEKKRKKIRSTHVLI